MVTSDAGKQSKSDATLQLDAIFRAFPDLLFSINSDGLILDYRAGKKSALYLPPERFIGQRIQDVLPAEIGLKFSRAIQDTLKTGKVVSIEYKLDVPAGERWFEARLCHLYESRAVIIVRDVTERVKNAQQIQSQLRRLSALHAVDAAITSSFDLNITLSVILRQLINQLGVDAADILIFNPTTHMLEYMSGQGFQAKKPQTISLMIGQGYAGKAALERRTISVHDFERQGGGFMFPANFIQEKFADYCAIPLISKGQVKGVLEIYQRQSTSPDDEWLDFLATVAGQAAVAIDSSGLFHDLQRSNAELSQAYDSAIESWAHVLELSNRESGAHAYRVVDLTLRLARAMGIEEENLVHFRRGALLHDVGKLGISETILNKPGPLSPEERQVLEGHSQLAYQLLSSVNYLAPALDIPHYHHEHWNGSGYPEGLREEQIPFPARLFAVVDVYDALTSTRPYRSSWTTRAALDYIEQNAGILFDPAVVKVFLRLMAEK